jgi:tripartite-type tricarboxylate transporter receptor subunit TctC
MINSNKFLLPAIAIVAVGAVCSGTASADSVSDFYKGKTVTLIVGSGAGGGFGLNGRLVGNHIGKHIPGNPEVVMQFMRGGGGTKAANFVYNVSPKDGTVISMPISSIVENQLLRPKGSRFDGAKFHWLGSITSLASVLSVWNTAPAKTIGDATKTQVILGATSTNSSWYRMVKLMNPVVGTKFKIVTGYKGSRGVDLAMERQEIHGRAMVWASTKARRGDWLKAGKLVHLAQIGPYKLSDMPNVPRLIDMAKTEKQKTMVRFLHLTGLIGRALHTTPGVPAERVAALRKAFDDTMKDPAFIAEFKKRKLPFGPTSGKDLQAFINKVIATPQSTIDELKTALKGG